MRVSDDVFYRRVLIERGVLKSIENAIVDRPHERSDGGRVRVASLARRIDERRPRARAIEPALQVGIFRRDLAARGEKIVVPSVDGHYSHAGDAQR